MVIIHSFSENISSLRVDSILSILNKNELIFCKKVQNTIKIQFDPQVTNKDILDIGILIGKLENQVAI